MNSLIKFNLKAWINGRGDKKNISNSQFNKKHVKTPNIWNSGKDCACTSATDFYLLIREYDTTSKFTLYSQNHNPFHNNRGYIYTYNGLLLSLKNPNKLFITLQ